MGRPAAGGLAIGKRVLSGEGNGGRVVVQLAQIEVELLDRVHHDLGHQGGSVGAEQSIQAPPDPIVVEVLGSLPRQPKERRLETARPLGKPIERPAREQHVAQQHAQAHRRGELLAPVACRDALAEEALDPEPLEKAVQQRQRAYGLGDELKSFGMRFCCGGGHALSLRRSAP